MIWLAITAIAGGALVVWSWCRAAARGDAIRESWQGAKEDAEDLDIPEWLKEDAYPVEDKAGEVYDIRKYRRGGSKK